MTPIPRVVADEARGEVGGGLNEIVAECARRMLAAALEAEVDTYLAAVLTCERLLADLDGCSGAPLSRESSDALALAPTAATWAVRYARNLSISERVLQRQPSPAVRRKGSRTPARTTLTRSCTTCWWGRSTTARRPSGRATLLAMIRTSRSHRRARPCRDRSPRRTARFDIGRPRRTLKPPTEPARRPRSAVGTRTR